MHGYETLTAAVEAAAPPSGEPDGLGPAPRVRHGDFAAGLRTRPHHSAAHGTFATGTCEPVMPAARTIGDFASRTSSSDGPRVIGDFATGTRARDDGQSRPDATDRPRSDRARQQPQWASA